MRRLILTAAVTAVMSVTACGSEPAQPASPPPADAGNVAASSAPAMPANPPAPSATTAVPANLQFTAKTLDGATFNGADLAGKPVVLWFWASWCSTCRAAAPNIRNLAAQYGTEVSFVGVAGLGEPKDMPGFVSQTKTAAFPHLSDQEGAVWRRFKITSQSSYVLLDATGKVAFAGKLSDGDLGRRVKQLAGA